jgi:hypothetical protein
VPYPLVTAAYPLAFALRVFDNNPQDEQQAGAIHGVCSWAGVPAPQPGALVTRSGGHALYAAWLAAKRAEAAYDDVTCNRCCVCFTDESVRVTVVR